MSFGCSCFLPGKICLIQEVGLAVEVSLILCFSLIHVLSKFAHLLVIVQDSLQIAKKELPE